MSFLIDTDICSAHLKNNNIVSNRFSQYLGRLNISTISVGELFTWAYRIHAPSRRYLRIDALFMDMAILPVTLDVAKKYGEIRAKLLDIGKPAPDMDLMIAATAIVHDLILVTHNTKDFANIPDLQIVDWLVS